MNSELESVRSSLQQGLQCDIWGCAVPAQDPEAYEGRYVATDCNRCGKHVWLWDPDVFDLEEDPI